MIISYDFNVPSSTFANSGSGGTLSATSTIVNASGNPAKNRGVYFEGTDDGYLSIPAFTLNHTMSLHAWILLKTIGTRKTIFSKDRDDFDPADDRWCLGAYVNASDKLEVDLGLDRTPYTRQTQESTSTLSVDTWYYSVISLEMTLGKDTIASLFLNNVADGIGTFSNLFLIDSPSYFNYIGIERSAATAFANHMNGYIYELQIYQNKHDTSNTAHAASCSTGCWTVDFNMWDNGGVPTACDSSTCTNRGCMNSEPCQATSVCETGFDFCHLCQDRECTLCDAYANCNASQCTATTHASEAGGLCTCNDAYGRAGEEKICIPCHINCKSCNPGGLDDFSDCTECMAGTNDIDATSDSYCTAYCPTGYTGGLCTLPGGSEMILNYNFNVPATTFANSGATGSTHDLTTVVIAPSGQPAKNRGIYFDGTNDGYLSVPDLLLGHSFSVHSWVLPYLGTDLTLFSKDRDDFNPVTDQHHLRLSINTGGNLVAELAQDIDPSNYASASSSTTLTADWTYLVYSFEMIDGKDKDILFYFNNVADVKSTLTGVFHIDSTVYKSYIAVERDAGPVFAKHWNGYIFDLALYQMHYSVAGGAHYRTSGCIGGCVTCPADLNCPWDDIFMNFDLSGTTTACDSGTCADISCVRDVPCHTCGSNPQCHLCSDRE